MEISVAALRLVGPDVDVVATANVPATAIDLAALISTKSGDLAVVTVIDKADVTVVSSNSSSPATIATTPSDAWKSAEHGSGATQVRVSDHALNEVVATATTTAWPTARNGIFSTSVTR